MQLQQRQSDGKPLRDHLLAGARNGAALDPRLVAQPPAGTDQLWHAFCDLMSARPTGMAGDKPVPPSEVQAWCAARRVRLSPWDLDTLAAMDRTALATAQALASKAKSSALEDDE